MKIIHKKIASCLDEKNKSFRLRTYNNLICLAEGNIT